MHIINKRRIVLMIENILKTINGIKSTKYHLSKFLPAPT